MLRAVIISSAILLAEGCVFEPLDLTDKVCRDRADCAPGFSCAGERCVPIGETDAGSDAPRDTRVDVRQVRDAARDTVSDSPVLMGDAGDGGDSGDAMSEVLPPDSGPSTYCDTVDAFLCEDFEGFVMDDWGLGTTSGASVIAIAGEGVDGSRGFRMRMTSHTGVSSINRQFAREYSDTTLYTRIYVRAPASEEFVEFNYLALHNAELRGDSISSLIRPDRKLGAWVAAARMPVSTEVSLTDEWLCVRQEIVLNATSGRMTLFEGSRQIGELTGQPTQPPGGISGVLLGVIYAPQPPATLFVDNLVIDDSPLPCE